MKKNFLFISLCICASVLLLGITRSNANSIFGGDSTTEKKSEKPAGTATTDKKGVPSADSDSLSNNGGDMNGEKLKNEKGTSSTRAKGTGATRTTSGDESVTPPEATSGTTGTTATTGGAGGKNNTTASTK